jgi:hypothetical protein
MRDIHRNVQQMPGDAALEVPRERLLACVIAARLVLRCSYDDD